MKEIYARCPEIAAAASVTLALADRAGAQRQHHFPSKENSSPHAPPAAAHRTREPWRTVDPPRECVRCFGTVLGHRRRCGGGGAEHQRYRHSRPSSSSVQFAAARTTRYLTQYFDSCGKHPRPPPRQHGLVRFQHAADQRDRRGGLQWQCSSTYQPGGPSTPASHLRIFLPRSSDSIGRERDFLGGERSILRVQRSTLSSGGRDIKYSAMPYSEAAAGLPKHRLLRRAELDSLLLPRDPLA